MLTNNMQFDRLINFSIEIAERTAAAPERSFLENMKARYKEGFFWPGRGMNIIDDFPTNEERKFWSRVFFDVARAIFDRKLGVHEHSFWQAQAIHQAHACGLIFMHAVRESEPNWSANTLDGREFDKIVNGIER